jgi:hypothetical protein
LRLALTWLWHALQMHAVSCKNFIPTTFCLQQKEIRILAVS